MKKNQLLKCTFILCIAFSLNANALAGSLDETARFLAGKGVATDSKLFAYTQAKFYKEYAEVTKKKLETFSTT